MKIITGILFVVFTASVAWAGSATTKVKQATISGVTVKIGQGADIVQGRISADRYEPAGHYGGLSRGYYHSGDTKYIITYGPPASGDVYVIKKIEKIEGKARK